MRKTASALAVVVFVLVSMFEVHAASLNGVTLPDAAQVGSAKLRTESHGEATGMGSRDQLLRIGADTVFKTSSERILCFLQHAALGRDCSLTVFQAAVPNCICCAIHTYPFSRLFLKMLRDVGCWKARIVCRNRQRNPDKLSALDRS